MQVENMVAEQALCRPFTVSHFEIEHAVVSNGIYADIRRFRWEEPCEARLDVDAYYIDYALSPRATQTHLLHSDRRHTILPGDIVFLPQGSSFDAHCEPSDHRLLCLTFESKRAVELFECDEREFDLPPCHDVRSPRVRQALARLAEEVREPGFGHDILIESVALSLVIELCRHFQERQKANEEMRGRIADWRLRRLKEQIAGGIAGPLSIADLAAECGMSPRHLIRTFKNTVGITLSEFISNARINHAKLELAKEDAMIKVVAGNCGFQSAAAFSASFRKATGVTPRQYRQERFRYDS